MSMSSLRRWRVVALLLLAVSPGAAGSVLPLLHPCPVDSPWLIHEAAPSHHAGHHAAAATAPDAEHHDQGCHCVGSCLVSLAISPPAPAGVAVPLGAASTQRWFPRDAALLLAARATLHPPATAPPLG